MKTLREEIGPEGAVEIDCGCDHGGTDCAKTHIFMGRIFACTEEKGHVGSHIACAPALEQHCVHLWPQQKWEVAK